MGSEFAMVRLPVVYIGSQLPQHCGMLSAASISVIRHLIMLLLKMLK
jgi:hypothetical protein